MPAPLRAPDPAEQAVPRADAVRAQRRARDARGLRAGARRLPGRTARLRQRGPAAADRRRPPAVPDHGPAARAREGLLGAGRGPTGRRRPGAAARRRRAAGRAHAYGRGAGNRAAGRAVAARAADPVARGDSHGLARTDAARRPQSPGTAHDGRRGVATLRLVRAAIGPWTLDGLAPGSWREVPEDRVREWRTGWQLASGGASDSGADRRPSRPRAGAPRSVSARPGDARSASPPRAPARSSGADRPASGRRGPGPRR